MEGTDNLPYLRAISLDIICAEITDKQYHFNSVTNYDRVRRKAAGKLGLELDCGINDP